MGWSEALSDDGKQTGRGHGVVRGIVTGTATVLGGIFHTLPFLIPQLLPSLSIALLVVVVELFLISWIRAHWLHVPLGRSLLSVAVGGLLVLGIGLLLGSA